MRHVFILRLSVALLLAPLTACGDDADMAEDDGGVDSGEDASVPSDRDSGTRDGGRDPAQFEYDQCVDGRCNRFVFGDGFRNFCTCLVDCVDTNDCVSVGFGIESECRDVGDDRFCVIRCESSDECPDGLSCESLMSELTVCAVPDS